MTALESPVRRADYRCVKARCASGQYERRLRDDCACVRDDAGRDDRASANRTSSMRAISARPP